MFRLQNRIAASNLHWNIVKKWQISTLLGYLAQSLIHHEVFHIFCGCFINKLSSFALDLRSFVNLNSSVNYFFLCKVDLVAVGGDDAVHAGLFEGNAETNFNFVKCKVWNVGSVGSLVDGDVVFLDKVVATKLLDNTWEDKHTVSEFFDMLIKSIISLSD